MVVEGDTFDFGKLKGVCIYNKFQKDYNNDLKIKDLNLEFFEK